MSRPFGRSDQQTAPQPQSSLDTSRTAAQQGNNTIVRFSIAICRGPNERVGGLPALTLMTPDWQRMPALLGQLRSFDGIRQYLRSFFPRTLMSNNIAPSQMVNCAAILYPQNERYRSGLVGPTADETEWQQTATMIANLFHDPTCQRPQTCPKCANPPIVVAGFPARLWQGDGPSDPRQAVPGRMTMLDGYHNAFAQRLYEASAAEYERYRNIHTYLASQREQSTLQAPTTGNQHVPSSVPSNITITHPSSSSRARPAPTPNRDPTRGPRGRSLLPTRTAPPSKPPDFSKGTLFPSTAHAGRKAESDTCLTCINQRRACSGTSMTFHATTRKARPGQWKCAQCYSKRRCLWRPSMDRVYTYDEVFAADGGRRNVKNTTVGRAARASKRIAEVAARRGQGRQSEEEGFDDDDDEEEEDDYEEDDDDGDEDYYDDGDDDEMDED